MKSPSEIVQHMMEKDAFSQWMGIEVLETGFGSCKLRCTIHKDMLNGHSILHGGISYSLSDSALAFASNSRGNRAVSIETSISHIRKGEVGDVLTAVATEVHRGRTIGIYEVTVTNQHDKVVSHFKGTVHVYPELW